MVKIDTLATKIGRIRLKNPVMVASGTFGYGEEFAEFIDLKRIGAIITKTITLKPRKGNPPPRIVETPCGMLNAIGLENPGVEDFIKQKLPFLRKTGVSIIVSIGGDNIDEFVELARRLDDEEGISGLELNISCPNIALHASRPTLHARNSIAKLISQDEDATYELVKAVRSVTKLTLITKLSPNVADIVAIGKVAVQGGSNALSLINTFSGMAIDINTRKPKLGNIIGGLSGPAIKPLALKAVWETAQQINIPIIGMGGIMDWQDALEFIIAGASAIAVGTANFVNPKTAIEIIQGLEDYSRENKITNIEELKGSLSH
ncbi:MAG: dihydroorotate dehydrogenase [Candidatus Omnitrophica bacterium]|nr:dihydroorotate dehydrogenase [Candidatus Omnitrophota bacterium]